MLSIFRNIFNIPLDHYQDTLEYIRTMSLTDTLNLYECYILNIDRRIYHCIYNMSNDKLLFYYFKNYLSIMDPKHHSNLSFDLS